MSKCMIKLVLSLHVEENRVVPGICNVHMETRKNPLLLGTHRLIREENKLMGTERDSSTSGKYWYVLKV